MATPNRKLQISLGSGVLFALMNIPLTSSKLLYNQDTKCPNYLGIALRTLVFFTLTFLSMNSSNLLPLKKLDHTIYGTLLFFFISNPETYKLTSSLLGSWISDKSGCPTINGISLHASVYIAILFGIMFLPN